MSGSNLSLQKELPASWFLAGTGTVLLVLDLVAVRLSGYPIGGEGCAWGWLVLSLGCVSRLAKMILCGWVGLLLRRTFPTPYRWLQVLLLVIMVGGICAYGASLMKSDWLYARLGQMMIAGVIFGYLLPVSSIKPHHAAELIVMSIVFAMLYSVSCLLKEYQWVRVIPMVAFEYVMLLLSFTKFAEKCVRPRWVQLLVIVFSAISFLISIRFFYFRFSPPIRQFLGFVVQPVTVWLISQLIQWLRPKKDCQESV